jgi:dTDP-4-dehydrorhamnose reductase
MNNVMTPGSAFLVVGGDSLVGGSAAAALAAGGARVYATTRRRETLGAGRIFLDFASPESYRAPPDVGAALLVAAVTSFERCEKDPRARIVNVELIPRTAAALLEQGLHVTFVSTDAVFGGERPLPDEGDPQAPNTAYAIQKSEGEAAIRAAADCLGATSRLTVVRLTKVMNAGVSPLPTWLAAWRRGESAEPFDDLVFAPISERFAGAALARIAGQRLSGNLHLSGAGNVSYTDFARALARRLGVAQTLIRPTTATAKGVHLAFKPRFSGLGMARTTALACLTPQPLEALIDDVAADIAVREAAAQGMER